jgi:hypothetical protein
MKPYEDIQGVIDIKGLANNGGAFMPNGNNSENIENYNENVQEYYAKLNELEREGEWDKIVDMDCAPITIDPNTNRMEGQDADR